MGASERPGMYRPSTLREKDICTQVNHSGQLYNRYSLLVTLHESLRMIPYQWYMRAHYETRYLRCYVAVVLILVAIIYSSLKRTLHEYLLEPVS